MKIAVIGGGNIGGTLGAAWMRTGHSVVYGSRNPQPPESTAIADAIAHAEVVLLAIPGAAAEEFAAANGSALDGKIVIDATNRIGDDTMNGSAAIIRHAPGARYVRAFNSVGWEVMAEPGEATLFWAGPDDEAIEQLIADVGFRGVRVGDAEMADVVDGVGRLWLTLVFRASYPRQIAFKLLGV
jgi:predicted dinucleotide-binding enzyme